MKETDSFFEELGEPPKDKLTVLKLRNMSKEELDELPASYFSHVENINQRRMNDIPLDGWSKEVTVFYISGEPGIGKSRLAVHIARDWMESRGESNRTFNAVKHVNTFWEGVGSASKVAIYDDFRDTHMKADVFINFVDYNIQKMNIKHGECWNRYELIIITSVQKLHDLYWSQQNGEPRAQWMRRINNIELKPAAIIPPGMTQHELNVWQYEDYCVAKGWKKREETSRLRSTLEQTEKEATQAKHEAEAAAGRENDYDLDHFADISLGMKRDKPDDDDDPLGLNN